MCRYTVTSGNLVLLFVWDTVCHLDFRSLIKQSQGNKWGFHPILVTSFLVVFSNAVTKILCNGLLIFHFVLSFLPFKRKTSYRKSHNPSEEKPKTKLPKYVMSQADCFWRLYDISYIEEFIAYLLIKINSIKFKVFNIGLFIDNSGWFYPMCLGIKKSNKTRPD